MKVVYLRKTNSKQQPPLNWTIPKGISSSNHSFSGVFAVSPREFNCFFSFKGSGYLVNRQWLLHMVDDLIYLDLFSWWWFDVLWIVAWDSSPFCSTIWESIFKVHFLTKHQIKQKIQANTKLLSSLLLQVVPFPFLTADLLGRGNIPIYSCGPVGVCWYGLASPRSSAGAGKLGNPKLNLYFPTVPGWGVDPTYVSNWLLQSLPSCKRPPKNNDASIPDMP